MTLSPRAAEQCNLLKLEAFLHGNYSLYSPTLCSGFKNITMMSKVFYAWHVGLYKHDKTTSKSFM